MNSRSSRSSVNETLDFSNRNLTELPSISKTTSVVSLNLAHNLMKSFPNLNVFTNLRYLNVANNSFANLTPLAALTGLVELDCSFNMIASIDFIQPMTKLKILNASHNNVSEIKARIPETLCSLNLSENKISSLKFLETNNLDNLEYLNVASSSMDDLVELKNLPLLPKLKKLDIGFFGRKGDIRLLEFAKFICGSLKEFDSQKIDDTPKIDFNDDEVVDILASGSEKAVIDFLNNQMMPIEWNQPVFIEYDDSPVLTDEEINKRLDNIEQSLNDDHSDLLDKRIKDLEKRVDQLLPKDEKKKVDPLALLITPNDIEDQEYNQIERDISLIRKEISTITAILYAHDAALEKIWERKRKH